MNQDFLKKKLRFFNNPAYYSQGRDLAVDPKEFSPARKYEFKKFFSFLGLRRGARVIELGAGYGRFVLPLLKLGYKVTAVDIAKEALRALTREARKTKLSKNLKTLQSDFTRPTFSEEFDAGFCISTFHLLSDKEEGRIKILENLVKNVKPGGVVLVIEPNPLNPLFYPLYFFSSLAAWNIEKYFTRSSEWNLRRIFKHLGLENIKLTYAGFLPLRTIDLFPAALSLNEFFNRIPLLNKFSSFLYIKGYKPKK